MRPTGWVAIAAVALTAVAAPSARAADTFADAALGDDANPCTSAASPCATIAAAVGRSGNGDTVRVAPGIYAEQVELGGGRSLRATGTAASTVIDGPASPAVDVTSAAGTIEGFTIRGGASGATGVLRLGAPATVRGNVFDRDDAASAQPLDVRIEAGAGSPTIRENSFVGDSPTGQTIAIRTLSTGSPQVAENRIDGYFEGIEITNGTPEVSHNVITGTHNADGAGQGSSVAIFSGPANFIPVLTGNVIRDPATNAFGTPDGINILDFVSGPGDPSLGATLRRNRVIGGFFGINVFGTLQPVTLDSDLVTAATGLGFSTAETVAGSGDVTATNVTIFGNAFDVRTTSALLTLNSSILGDPIQALGTGSCAIAFSRLSATATPAAPSCDDAATTADPQFVNAAGGDYHLQDGSPLRNAGDPGAPPAGALDFDGEPRLNLSCLPGAIRRDIGADETIGGGCARPQTEITSGPAGGSQTAGGPAARSPEWGFGSDAFEPGFGCSLDGGFFVPCASPRAYRGLAPGGHTFSVHAIDQSGTRDDTPATVAFEVDGTPPDTQFASGPAEGETSDATPAFGLSSEAGASFECSVDRAPFAPCAATFDPPGLADGQHRIAARATDSVGNADPTAATRTWTVDGTAPETTIDSGPQDGASASAGTATYGFSASEPSTFECATDGGPFAACESPVTLAALSPGTHTFAVRATDAVGNADASPATRSVQVPTDGSDADTDPPETRIRRVKVKGDDAKARFTSDEPGSSFRCKLDRKKPKPCRSPRRMRNLDDGRHRLKVWAIDPAGNADPSPAKKRFGV